MLQREVGNQRRVQQEQRVLIEIQRDEIERKKLEIEELTENMREVEMQIDQC